MDKFDLLKEKYGSHKEVAKALGLPERTYRDWRTRAYSRDTFRRRIDAALDHLIENSAHNRAQP